MNNAIEIKKLKKKYDNNFELGEVNIEIPSGYIIGLIGENGAGKTTLIKSILNIINRDSGEIKIFNKNNKKYDSLIKEDIGVVLDGMFFSEILTSNDINTIMKDIYDTWDKELFYKYLNNFKIPNNKKIKELSKGMRKKLEIAVALSHKPKLLILDEPTAGVDIELRRSMWDFLIEMNNRGTSIILTTHYLEEAEMLCRRIAIIDRGVIKEDTSMKAFLNQLNEESFIFDLAEPIQPIHIDILGVKFNLIDAVTLEVTMDKAHTLNELFQLLEAQGIRVRSMRNKSNRLEELFVKMVEKNLNGEA